RRIRSATWAFVSSDGRNSMTVCGVLPPAMKSTNSSYARIIWLSPLGRPMLPYRHCTVVRPGTPVPRKQFTMSLFPFPFSVLILNSLLCSRVLTTDHADQDANHAPYFRDPILAEVQRHLLAFQP